MTTEVTLNPSVTNVTVSSTDALSVDLTTSTTTVELTNGEILPQSLGTTDSPTFGSVTTNQTTVVNSTAQTASNFYRKRMIHTGGAVTYTFAATNTISGTDIGKSVVVVNAGTGDIQLDITTSKFFELVPSLDTDYADSSSGGKTGTNAHKLVKGGVAEFIVTETNKILIIGSGIQ